MAAVSKTRKPMKLLVPPLKSGVRAETKSSGLKGREPARTKEKSTFVAAPEPQSLTASETKAHERAKLGLQYLQTLWPVDIESPRAFRWGGWGVVNSLPKELGDTHRALLKPVADAIDHVQNALRTYEGRINIPRDYEPPQSLYHTMPDNFGALIREANENGKAHLSSAVVAKLEQVAKGWDARYDHPGLLGTHPEPFHRETEVERLAKLAGVKPGQYPDAHILAAKAAWDRGEREVVFDQLIGNSTGSSMGIRRQYSSEGAFIFNHCRARTGTFGHWQTV